MYLTDAFFTGWSTVLVTVGLFHLMEGMCYPVSLLTFFNGFFTIVLTFSLRNIDRNEFLRPGGDGRIYAISVFQVWDLVYLFLAKQTECNMLNALCGPMIVISGIQLWSVVHLFTTGRYNL